MYITIHLRRDLIIISMANVSAKSSIALLLYDYIYNVNHLQKSEKQTEGQTVGNEYVLMCFVLRSDSYKLSG